MLLRMKRWWQFIVRAMSSGSWSPKKQSKQDSISSSTYRAGECYADISILPLSRFVDVVVDENLKALVKSGDPDNSQLLTAWDKIREQYAHEMKDADYSVRVHLLKEIHYLRVKYDQIQHAIALLRRYYTKEFADLLNKYLLTNFKFDISNPEQYEKELKSANTRSKSILMRLQIQEDTYKKMMQGKEDEDDKTVTRASFQGMLIALSNHVGYQVKDDISTYEYCVRVNNLNDYIEKHEQQNGRGKNR